MGKDQEFLEAARNGNISFVEKVLGQRAKRAGPLASLRRGPGVNVQDSGGYSALHHACLNGHSDIVRLLLANEASPDLPDSRGSSALHLASWAGHEDIVKMLLTHPYRPANPNLQTIEHETPLHCAAQHGHTEALALLLAHDADPKMRNTRGETPLDLAAQYGRLQAVQMLIRAHPELIAPYTSAAIEAKSSRHSPLPHSGSVSTPSPSSPSMYSSPATPTRNIFPHTCLHLASRNGHKSVVEVLLAAGVSVNLQTPSGTALHEAALCGKESVVRTLLRADIDLNATDAEGRTALDILKEFPPHVTKHIIAVINNFRNQMDTDDGEEVVYRHHPNAGQPQQQQQTASVYRNSTNTTTSHYQQQRQHHNNHYHFNSNNHLLNHSHSMQQSSYSKPRYANSFNGGKSLDSGLQPDDSSGCGGTGGPGSSEMGVSPSSSMSSFEPASVSPRSRSSTGGLITINHHHHNPTHHPIPLGTFVPPPLPPTSAPPKKPPRRNLSVSPTHTGQHFTYTSPNHQTGQGGVYKNNPGGARRGQQTRSPSNESPYSHQSHGSVGGMSLDETQLRDRPRGDRLYASARESTRSATGITMSSSNDMLEKSNNYNETYGSNELSSSLTNSMKRPIPAPRKGLVPVSKDIINCENPTLKSYNPNRKLKRNRNSYSLGMGDKQRCSISSDSNSDPKQPLSPTNYKQPPTPDHPPPSSSHAERTIHERIRPLSQEYKRRSALLQQQQILIDSGTSPPKNFPLLPAPPAFDYAYGQTPIYHAAGLQGSSGSLSSSVSYSDQSVSTDCVEEFVGDAPFSGLLKGSTVNIGHDQSNGNGLRQQFQAMNKVVPTAPPRNLPAEDETAKQRNARPPIPTKPALLEKRVLKPPIPPTVPTVATVPNSVGKTVKHVDSETQGDVKNGNVSAAESASKDEISSCTESPPTEGQNGSSNEDSSTTTATGTENGGATSQESSILSPFNAEEARKKISEIIESFGSGILNSNITPTNDIELDFEDMEVSAERREFAVRLHQAGLFHLERMLFENGYDNYKFVNGVFDGEPDTKLMQIADKDAAKLIKLVKTLPPAEFQPQIPLKPQQENKPSSGNPVETSKGVATLVQWLNSISLPEYVESFNKHLYNTIDSVCGVWDVELQTVLQINKLGHRRRILQSLAYIRQMREPKSVKTPLAENMETNKMPSNGRLEGPSNTNRSSISGYRKNRPAPQPPTSKPAASPQKNAESQQTQEPLQIRNPSELLLGLPVNLRTKWRHSANVLLKEQIKYEVQYLGSTVVKELRGTESTRKSIQKLKRDECSGTTPNQQMLLGSRNSATNRPSKRPLVCLAISHRGVEFINVDNKQTICEHEIQNINCACQDSDDLRHFAYITKENDIHYCHVFSVDSTDLATEIILTLGQAFEVAYQLALRDGIIATPLNLEPNSILQTESAAGMEAAAK